MGDIGDREYVVEGVETGMEASEASGAGAGGGVEAVAKQSQIETRVAWKVGGRRQIRRSRCRTLRRM